MPVLFLIDTHTANSAPGFAFPVTRLHVCTVAPIGEFYRKLADGTVAKQGPDGEENGI
jgi:hypothetical protein